MPKKTKYLIAILSVVAIGAATTAYYRKSASKIADRRCTTTICEVHGQMLEEAVIDLHPTIGDILLVPKDAYDELRFRPHAGGLESIGKESDANRARVKICPECQKAELPPLSSLDNDADVSIELQKPEDNILVRYGQDVRGAPLDCIVEIVSESGIGGMTISQKSGRWPMGLCVRLKGFTNLESYGINNRIYVATGKLRFETFCHLSKPSGEKNNVIGTISITVLKSNRGIDIWIPPVFFQSDNPIHVGWVDAFR